MAGEIQASYSTGKTVYCLIRDRTGNIWNGSAFVSYLTANYSLYVVSLTEQGSASGYYAGTFPASAVAGIYNITAKNQSGGSPLETDATIAVGDLNWNGSATLPLSDLATSGQIGQVAPIKVYRGQMLSNFMFKLVSSADHITPFTSGVCSGQISKDGAAFTALASGIFAEVGLGFYKTTMVSGDLLCNTAAITFTANGISGGSSDPRDFSMILQRTSGVA